MKTVYSIGADPELFLQSSNGTFFSSHEWVKGTKEEPFKVSHGATQVDGVAGEFNIDPAYSPDEFNTNIEHVIIQMQQQVDQHTTDLTFVAEPVATFEQPYFDRLPELTKALGCMPDFNAYTKEQNEPPVTDQPFRTGSGHVHVGYSNFHDYENEVCRRVMQLDYSLFLVSLLWDGNQKRRELYGKPGAFRFKPYGFEYRVLSNAWVGDVELRKWIYEATVKAMKLYDSNDLLFDESTPPFEAYEKDSLLDYHDYLVDDHGFPQLPKVYLSGRSYY